MSKETLALRQVIDQCAWLTMAQRDEVQDLLLKIEALILSASDVSVASATIRVYGAVTRAALVGPPKKKTGKSKQSI